MAEITWVSYPANVGAAVRNMAVRLNRVPSDLAVDPDATSLGIDIYRENGVIVERAVPGGSEIYLTKDTIDEHNYYIAGRMYPDSPNAVSITLYSPSTGDRTAPIRINITPPIPQQISTEAQFTLSDDFNNGRLFRERWATSRTEDGIEITPVADCNSSYLQLQNRVTVAPHRVKETVISDPLRGPVHVEFRGARETARRNDGAWLMGVMFYDTFPADAQGAIDLTKPWGGLAIFGINCQAQLDPFCANDAATDVHCNAAGESWDGVSFRYGTDTVYTLPGGGLTTAQHDYVIDFDGHILSFSIDGIVVSQRVWEIPLASAKYWCVFTKSIAENLGPVGGMNELHVERIDAESDERLVTAVQPASGGGGGGATEATQLLNKIDLDALVNQGKAAVSATETSVVAANASTLLLAANPSRRMFAIRNDSDKAMYVAYGGAASATSTTKIPATGYYEDTKPPWTGTVYAFGEAGVVGNWRVREIT